MTLRCRIPLAAACALLCAGSALAGSTVGVPGSVVANAPKIIDEGDLGKTWRLADGIQLETPAYPAQFADRGDQTCVAIGYTVLADGSTSDFVLLEGWNSQSGRKEPAKGYWQAFAGAASDAIAQWRFQPREDIDIHRDTVTVSTFAFRSGDDMSNAAVRSRCDIPDLAYHIHSIGNVALRDSLLMSQLASVGRDYRSQPHWMTVYSVGPCVRGGVQVNCGSAGTGSRSGASQSGKVVSRASYAKPAVAISRGKGSP